MAFGMTAGDRPLITSIPSFLVMASLELISDPRNIESSDYDYTTLQNFGLSTNQTTNSDRAVSRAHPWENTSINCTSAGNSSNGFNSTNGYYFYQKEQVTFLVVLFVAIVFGNVAVLTAIFLSKKPQKSRMNFFVMHLAMADLLVGLISVLTDLIWKITLAWHAGQFMCKIVRYFQAVVIYASTYILVALSIDRLDAIARPMNFMGSSLRAKLLIAIAWGLSCLFSVPMLVFNNEMIEKDGSTQCRIRFSLSWHWQLYMTLISVVLFIIPAIVIAGCYAVIVYVIWYKTKAVTQMDSHASVRHMTAASYRSVSGGSAGQQHTASGGRHHSATFRPARYTWRTSRNEDGGVTRNGTAASDAKTRPRVQRDNSFISRGLIPQAKIKTIKMTFVIVLAFIMCWSPYFIFDLMDVYGLIRMERQRHRAISIFIQSLAPLNSVANPIIFSIFGTSITHYLRRVKYFHCCVMNWFCCLCCCVASRFRRQSSTLNPTKSCVMTIYDNNDRNCMAAAIGGGGGGHGAGGGGGGGGGGSLGAVVERWSFGRRSSTTAPPGVAVETETDILMANLSDNRKITRPVNSSLF